ncbi:MAG TPA: LysM peptidoglycan-binding domain-containing protein [Acidobacteriaceae bacterium]|nr:LysM peptidoglycan-binding domain-containing protein [Acidobacteriaceae bacterium]
MPDSEKLMGMAANTAILGAFACEAPELAFVIGAAQFFLDMVWPAAQAPTQMSPVDDAYLSSALDDLKSEITDAMWLLQLKVHTDAVLHASSIYWGYLKQFQQMTIDTDPESEDELDAYFRTAKSKEYPFDVLDNARLYITTDATVDKDLTPLQVAEHYTKTIGLYAVIGSAMIAYLKASVAWRRAKLMYPYLEYAKYQVALAKYEKLDPNHQHPAWKPADVPDPNPNGKNPLPDWHDWIQREESGVPRLIETVNTLVGYAEGTPATATAPATTGLQVDMAQHWKATIDNIRARLDQMWVAPQIPRGNYDGSGKDLGPFWVVDTAVGRPYVEYTVAAGDTLTSIASTQSRKTYSRLTADDLFFMNFDVFVDYGRMTSGGGYQIAQASWWQLDKTYDDATFLLPGMVLKLPNLHTRPPMSREFAGCQWFCRSGAALAYEWETSMDHFALSGINERDITDFGKVIQLWKRARASVQFTPYTVKAGDTLLSIAGGDAVLADKIYKFNSDTLKSPAQNLIAGQVINIPDASVLSDIQ